MTAHLIHTDGWYCTAANCQREHGRLDPGDRPLTLAQVGAMLPEAVADAAAGTIPRVYAYCWSPAVSNLQILRLTSRVYIAALEAQGWSIRACFVSDTAHVPVRRA